jgi:class 3 adenylate cyclase
MKKRTIKSIAITGESVERLNRELELHSAEMAYIFVDLCGSTELKERLPQSQWLPKVCRFLFNVAQCVEKNHGKVIKYIGDEIFAVFRDDKNPELCPFRVENFIRECEATLSKMGADFSAKYACDFGRSVLIDDNGDVIGTCVDRCARIAKLTAPHIALASAEFVEAAKGEANWKKVGRFPLKGLKDPVAIFQLREFGPLLKIQNPQLYSASPSELIAMIQELSEQRDKCKMELRIARDR